MFVGSLLLFALQGADILQIQSPITVQSDVGAAYKAIAAMSKASGVSLRIQEPLAGETVFLHVKNRPLGEVAARLATAVGGTWTKDDKGFVLVRDESIGASATEVNRRFQAFSKYRDQWLSAAKKPITEATIVEAIEDRNRLNKRTRKAQAPGAMIRSR